MKVAIAGFGREGRENFVYWHNRGDAITIVDEREQIDDLPAGVTTILGKDAFRDLNGFDLVVRTAGLAPYKITTDSRVWSATNEFFARCPVPIIGVTGTKGKGTTASLITAILRAAGRTVHLVGNIGLPALSVLSDIKKDDIVVYELSSFQLWDIERSPHIAVLLGIEPDHLDVHKSMDDYVQAKANITRFQTADDTLVFNWINQYSHDIADHTLAQKVPYPFDISTMSSSLKIPGEHNIQNAAAAVAAVREYTRDEDAIRRGFASFTGLPHRLKFVAEKNGVKYYDDSIATTPGSAIAALRSFSEPKVIILGGSDKGAEYDSIIKECQKTKSTVAAIGQTGHKIRELCEKYDVLCTYLDGTMAQIVAQIARHTEQGSVVILSPASASFDMFRNYVDRGEQFIAAVQSL